MKTCRYKFQHKRMIPRSKTKGKLKIMKDNIVDGYVTHTMTTRNTKTIYF